MNFICTYRLLRLPAVPGCREARARTGDNPHAHETFYRLHSRRADDTQRRHPGEGHRAALRLAGAWQRLPADIPPQTVNTTGIIAFLFYRFFSFSFQFFEDARSVMDRTPSFKGGTPSVRTALPRFFPNSFFRKSRRNEIIIKIIIIFVIKVSYS